MGFQLSPGVVTSEIDLTTIVPAVATSTGAYAGPFSWGPADVPIQVSDEVRLVEFFGKPSANVADAAALESARSFFTCANFLAYGNDLRVVRSHNSATDNNAIANASTNERYKIKNQDVYFNSYHSVDSSSSTGAFVARYPGSLGNSLRVEVWANTSSSTYSTWTYASYFNSVPGTSLWANSKVANCNDEIHIVVIDEDGYFSGTKGTVLETFGYVSKALDAKDDTGNSNYFREVIYRKSKYIYATGFPHGTSVTTDQAAIGGVVTRAGKRWGQAISNLSSSQSFVETSLYTASLVNGNEGASTDASNKLGYDKFVNAEEIDISLVLAGAHPVGVQQYIIDNICESRKDCVAFVSPTLASTQTTTAATDIAAFRNNTLNRSTSYAVMDSAWKYQYDKYNDMYRWIPSNGDMAGLCVRTDATRDPWFSPAGITRGQMKNVIKLSFNPNKTDRDTLYKNGVNPIVSFPGEGVILFGDKTLLSKPSAFDRINVRRLFIVLEKAIARAARSSLFEFNDEFTRAQFVSIVEPFLRDVKGRRGIYDFRVVCDSTNNTGEVIDRNEFRGDIYVKPARSINFIQLNFVAVRTGVSFDEVVGKF